MAVKVELPYEYFQQPTAGKPVAGGSLYVGVKDLDPTVPANQITVTARQEDGTEVPISQPISLSAGGTPLLSGSPVMLLVDVDHSLTVLDSLGSQVYTAANAGVSGPTVNNDKRHGVEFANIAALTSAPPTDIAGNSVDLQSGMVVWTSGYTTAGDGGGARYLIQTSAEFGGTPDGFGDHALANGNVAVLQVGVRADLKQYGAAGNGTTDDTAAVQACFDANTNITGRGQFLLSDDITVTQNFTSVFGDDWSLQFRSATDHTMFYVSGHWVKFQDVDFFKTATSSTFHMYGADTINLKAINCRFEAPVASTFAGLTVGSAADYSKLASASGMLDSTAAANFMTHIERCQFTQASIWLTHSDCRILNNFVWASEIGSNSSFTIRLGNTANILVKGNDILPSPGFGGGIALYNVSQIRIQNNFFDGNNNVSIFTKVGIVDIGATNNSYLQITDNTFWRISENGIKLNYTLGSTISGNSFLNCNKADAGHSDIVVDSTLSTATGNIISNNNHQNTVSINKGYAIEIKSTTGNWYAGSITDNVMKGNYLSPLYSIANLQKNRVRIFGNTMDDLADIRTGTVTISAASTTAFPRWTGQNVLFPVSYENLTIKNVQATGGDVSDTYKVSDLAADGFNLTLKTNATVNTVFAYEYIDKPV